MKHQNTAKIITTLKKARSHLDKIIQMIEKGEYCINIIQQINAIQGYLSSAKRNKLVDHLNSCFVDGLARDKEKRKQNVEEVIRILKIS